jgi:phosphohistidine phosphatase SixA
MKTNLLWFFYAYLLLTFSSVLMAANNPETLSPENTLNDTRLIFELRQGGYILYFRHGKTDHNTFDTDRKNLSDCSSQRLLSEEGREEMILIGNTIKKLGIKIGSVISSPYCRSIDTATRAFGRAEINPDLKHTVIADEATMHRQAKALQKMLSKVPAIEGTNDVLSAHTANLQEATGIWPKPVLSFLRFSSETSKALLPV